MTLQVPNKKSRWSEKEKWEHRLAAKVNAEAAYESNIELVSAFTMFLAFHSIDPGTGIMGNGTIRGWANRNHRQILWCDYHCYYNAAQFAAEGRHNYYVRSAEERHETMQQNYNLWLRGQENNDSNKQ